VVYKTLFSFHGGFLDRPRGSVRKCARGKKCLRECGKFGQRAGKTPPNTNNINNFSLEKQTNKKKKTNKQTKSTTTTTPTKTEKKSRYAVSRYAVTPLRVLLLTTVLNKGKCSRSI
jgi:hypothetical protein